MNRNVPAALLTALGALSALFALSCSRPAAPPAAGAETFSVTAWSPSYEVFAEIDPLVAGSPSHANTHVTLLAGFAPVASGTVTAVLTDASGRETASAPGAPKRPGIFGIDVTPPTAGRYALAFRIAGDGTPSEEVAAGVVVVAAAGAKAPARPDTQAGAVSFLKEQQWKTEFATDWASERSLPAGVAGPARVVPAGGGEVVVTAPLDAVLAPAPWPYRGQALAAGATVFRLVPRVAEARSLAELEAESASLEAELAAASARARRLEGLVKLEAVSTAEVERAQATETAQKARLGAARHDLSAARAARAGGTKGAAAASVTAPFGCVVAEVLVTPGQSVAAGTPIARLVRARPVWVDVALSPGDAALLAGGARGAWLRLPASDAPLFVAPSAMRVVSRAPEVDARTGTVGVLVEVEKSAAELPLGTTVAAEILLFGERRGVIVPGTAIVDDGGVPVVYEQVTGESFAGHHVAVAARRGPDVLVTGLAPGVRIVTKGAAAIRRASLLSSGAPEGHVH